MNMNFVWIYFAVAITILIFFLPIVIKPAFVFNLTKNNGMIDVKIFSIKVFTAEFYFEDGGVALEKRGKKLIKNKIILSGGDVAFGFNLFRLILKNIDIKSISIYSYSAVTDPYHAVMFRTFLDALSKSLIIFISAVKNTRQIENQHLWGFNDEKLILKFKITIWISIFDILKVLIKSKINAIKSNKRKRQSEAK